MTENDGGWGWGWANLVGGGYISSCFDQSDTQVLVALGRLAGERQYRHALSGGVVVVGAAVQRDLGTLEVSLRRRDAVEQHACTVARCLFQHMSSVLFLARSANLPAGLHILRRVWDVNEYISVVVGQIVTKFGECVG